jgi:hypothetical protein
MSGSILSSEIKQLEFSFTPLKKKKYKVHIPISLQQLNPAQPFGYFLPGSALNTQSLKPQLV